MKQWAIVAVAIMAVSITLAVTTVQAQDSELIRVESDYTAHMQEISYFHYSDYLWVYNPTNLTFTYGEDHEYTADPIEHGHWDVIPLFHKDPVTHREISLNDDLLVKRHGHSAQNMIIHLVNVTETQTVQIQELQAVNERLQADLQAQYTLNDQLTDKLATQAKRIAALEATLQNQTERLAVLEQVLNEPIPQSPFPPS